uniref:Uncharacterized protein n=1 Tax=Salix viminalis TaxID=40686 RepID=A0A6N2K9J8_SALVM
MELRTRYLAMRSLLHQRFMILLVRMDCDVQQNMLSANSKKNTGSIFPSPFKSASQNVWKKRGKTENHYPYKHETMEFDRAKPNCTLSTIVSTTSSDRNRSDSCRSATTISFNY